MFRYRILLGEQVFPCRTPRDHEVACIPFHHLLSVCYSISVRMGKNPPFAHSCGMHAQVTPWRKAWRDGEGCGRRWGRRCYPEWLCELANQNHLWTPRRAEHHHISRGHMRGSCGSPFLSSPLQAGPFVCPAQAQFVLHTRQLIS